MVADEQLRVQSKELLFDCGTVALFMNATEFWRQESAQTMNSTKQYRETHTHTLDPCLLNTVSRSVSCGCNKTEAGMPQAVYDCPVRRSVKPSAGNICKA